MSIKCLAWAWGRQLPPLPKLILLAVADHADDTGFAWPGINGVAEKCGLSRRTVQRHMNYLTDKGLITVEPRTRPDGSATSNSYQVNIPPVSERHPPASGCHPPVSPVTPPRVSTVTPLTVIEPSYTTTTILPEWFQVLYDIEPVDDKTVERLTKWASPHDVVVMREMAYLLAGKWEEYEGKRASIYPTFQNWVNRQEKNPTDTNSKKGKKSVIAVGLLDRAIYEVEAYIQAQGLHPASQEATEIRRNWGK
jgi:hypothetical protein